MTPIEIAVIIAAAAIVGGYFVWRLVRRAKGKPVDSCGGDCAGCSGCSACKHLQKKNK